MNGSLTKWKILPSPSEKNLPLRDKIIKFRYQKLVCFFQALDEHAYDWNLKDFTSSIPHILSLPPVSYDLTFGCDSTLTEIIVRKSYLEYHQKICLFKSMKKIADGLDCGEDVLHVVMCRGPFLLLEQVSIYCRLHVIFKMF